MGKFEYPDLFDVTNGTNTSELSTLGRVIDPHSLDEILQSPDIGFACPRCGDTSKVSPCSYCGIVILPCGEGVDKPEDIPDLERWEALEPKEGVGKGKNYSFGSTDFILFSRRSIGKSEVNIHLQFQGIYYSITFVPGIEKMVRGIYIKNSKKYKRTKVSEAIFKKLLVILREISQNPREYGLSQLKAFKK